MRKKQKQQEDLERQYSQAREEDEVKKKEH